MEVMLGEVAGWDVGLLAAAAERASAGAGLLRTARGAAEWRARPVAEQVADLRSLLAVSVDCPAWEKFSDEALVRLSGDLEGPAARRVEAVIASRSAPRP